MRLGEGSGRLRQGRRPGGCPGAPSRGLRQGRRPGDCPRDGRGLRQRRARDPARGRVGDSGRGPGRRLRQGGGERLGKTIGPRLRGAAQKCAEFPGGSGIIPAWRKLSLSDSSHLTAEGPCWQA